MSGALRALALTASLVTACSSTEEPVEPVAQQLMAVSISEPDSLSVNGVCSLREAWRVIANSVPSADCGTDDGSHTITLGAGTWTMALANQSPVTSEDTSSVVGDLDATGTVAIVVQGAGAGQTVLDAAGLDRIFHVKGGAALELRDLTLRGGCVNGGTCTTATAGSEPVGGLVYHNSFGRFRATNTAWENGSARTGGALGLCSALDSDGALSGATFTNNTATLGGGAIESHTTWSCTACSFTGNSTGGIGGAIKQYDRVATLMYSDVHSNSAASVGGGWAAVGQWNASTAGHVDQVGGELYGNTASQKGGNVYVGAVGTQGQGGLYSVPCAAAGCSGSVTGVSVASGTAPSGPDCSGTLDAWAGATVANAAGCNVVTHGPACGNATIEDGEQCDGGQCCTELCAFAALGASCSDGDECTPADACDGSGACVGSGESCGDGALQPACGEQCDDNNAVSLDGCSAQCASETCVAWE